MRISDWSSDVCSSDLQPRRLAAGRTQNRARRKCARGAGPRATGGGAGRHRLRNRCAGDEGRRGGGHVPRRKPFQDQLSARDPPHRQPPGRGTIQGLSSVASGQGRFRAIWIRREVRSEEHTSELQSLMRISYAVFCLKKKKHKKQQDLVRQQTVNDLAFQAYKENTNDGSGIHRKTT